MLDPHLLLLRDPFLDHVRDATLEANELLALRVEFFLVFLVKMCLHVLMQQQGFIHEEHLSILHVNLWTRLVIDP